MKKTSAFISILLVFGILVMVNLLSYRKVTRYDLTENKVYSISEVTKKMLRALDDVITVKCYFTKSRELPRYMVRVRQQVEDLLKEFQIYAGNKLKVEFIDPKDEKDVESRLRTLGVPEVKMDVLEKDQRLIKLVYFGIVVFYEDRHSVIPFIGNTANLEYELSCAIKKVKQKQQKTIGFLTAHDEHNIYDDYEVVRKFLQKQYNIITVDLSTGNEVPASVTTLVVAGPKKEFKEYEKYRLDQFLMRGGKLVLLLDKVDIGRNLRTKVINFKIEDLLKHYGFEVEKNLIQDVSNALASFDSGHITFTMRYPFFVRTISPNLNRKIPVTQRIESIVFPWVSSIKILKSKEKKEKSAKIEYIEIAKTTKFAHEQKHYFDITPKVNYEKPKKGKQFLLAAAASGKFKSFYADKDPVLYDKDNKPDKMKKKIEEAKKKKLNKSPDTQIVLIGDSDFLSTKFARSRFYQTNLNFFMNLIDWLTVSEELIAVRSKRLTDRPILKEIPENDKKFYIYMNMFAVPVILGIILLIRWIIRRRLYLRYEKSLGATSVKLTINPDAEGGDTA